MKHTRVPFPRRLDQRTKSHFELVHTDVGVLPGLSLPWGSGTLLLLWIIILVVLDYF